MGSLSLMVHRIPNFELCQLLYQLIKSEVQKFTSDPMWPGNFKYYETYTFYKSFIAGLKREVSGYCFDGVKTRCQEVIPNPNADLYFPAVHYASPCLLSSLSMMTTGLLGSADLPRCPDQGASCKAWYECYDVAMGLDLFAHFGSEKISCRELNHGRCGFLKSAYHNVLGNISFALG